MDRQQSRCTQWIVLFALASSALAAPASAATMVNLALGKPTTANSEWLAASNAVDGDYLSYWAAFDIGSPGAPMWLEVDLEQSHLVEQIVVTGIDASQDWDDTINDYSLYGALEQGSWSLLGAGTWVHGDTIRIHDIDDASFRYLRYEVIGGRGRACLAEFEALTVPEPALLGVLLFGGMALLWRRRTTA